MKLDVVEQHDSELFDALVAGVRHFNTEVMGPETSKPLMTIARNDQGELVGGVSGRTIYNNFLIEVVWVADEARGTGLGRQLMQQAEQVARQRGCVVAQVDTMGFQASGFYQKLGFEVIGQVNQVEGSPDRVFLMKHYNAPDL